MTQVIDFIGGEYRNRTGVHGFAKLGIYMKYMKTLIRYSPLIARTNQESLDAGCGLALAFRVVGQSRRITHYG